MTAPVIQSHAAAEQALFDLWADCRDSPTLPAAVRDQLAALLTSGGALERKVMVPELVLAHAEYFSVSCRELAAALADFAVHFDFFAMASSGRGMAVQAALLGTASEPVEPLARFVLPVVAEGGPEE